MPSALASKLLTPRPHRRHEAARHPTQRLGNHCCQLGCSHIQCAAVCVNTSIDNNGFQDIALRDPLRCMLLTRRVGGVSDFENRAAQLQVRTPDFRLRSGQSNSTPDTDFFLLFIVCSNQLHCQVQLLQAQHKKHNFFVESVIWANLKQQRHWPCQIDNLTRLLQPGGRKKWYLSATSETRLGRGVIQSS